ncbi:Shr3 amino acid permease chaperone [Penicillium cf. griseofulvum]|uniref:Shr3 amino acid permease chaperone n=1 Tax=Penicillium cf. griseofulvum TaxID=2972120 RepID=A0A9W9J033_9EURO|nr:Shr3 amino acid permease chaperone [Penicillium cf. griseofulvum]KAJ5430104.1 Shr3 amino acid permease chaperone [Penicillium cf. griseofulvum]KAJ5436124.1 Shr3 amino acid permease chaperone [Penicillium cf. griseofulvum]
MAFKSGSFATFLIVCPTCFFLGIIFSLFPYDYPILWSTVVTPSSHYDYLEAHLRFLHASPPLIPRILHIVIFLGLAGLLTKLYKPSESNMLFDGASLVLYMCGVTVYIANIVKGLRLASAGQYGAELGPTEDEYEQILGREDSLKVLSASNTILALVLVGILVLQAGQWYAESKDIQEDESFAASKKNEKESGDANAATSGSSTATASKSSRQGSQRKKSN